MSFHRFAFGIAMGAALLAACGGSVNSLDKPNEAHLSSQNQNSVDEGTSVSDRIIHVFGVSSSGVIDGIYPEARLLPFNNGLYGTTFSGGAYGEGTVFAIGHGPAEKILYSFRGGPQDGANPAAGLINVKGTLYGTTYQGGPYCSSTGGCGTVFSLTPSGKETVLYSFGSKAGDAENPAADLIHIKGKLYGTTRFGGSTNCFGAGAKFGCGAVFSITLSGKETVLHSFSGMPDDGMGPVAQLIDINGTLYGTTEYGGSGGAYCPLYSATGCGTVYSITTKGHESVLYSFKGKPDGEVPLADLLDINGTMYGTTYSGGEQQDGTVFSIDTSGKENVLYSFPSYANDGAYPSSALIDIKGTLYGTTTGGGVYTHGTAFSITPSGSEAVYHSFSARSEPGHVDGSDPTSALTVVGSNLYTTTYHGGAILKCELFGCGTVVKIPFEQDR